MSITKFFLLNPILYCFPKFNNFCISYNHQLHHFILFPRKDIDDCQSHSCRNEGTCVDMIAGYRCQCRHGFNGTHCENGTLCNVLSLFNLRFVSSNYDLFEFSQNFTMIILFSVWFNAL